MIGGVVRALDAVFFDIDDTLFSTSTFAGRARRAAVDAMIGVGLKASHELVLRELEEVIQEFTSNHDRHFDKTLFRLPPDALRGLNPALVVAAGVVAYHETKWRELRVYDDVYDTLKWLSELSAPPVRGIISAGWTIKQAEKVIRLGVLEFLSPEAVFFTDQIGINKPNPKLYQRVLAQLGLAPGRVLYVGDNPIHDIDAANQVGIRTARVRREGKYRTLEGSTPATHDIRDFHDLRNLLVQDYGF
jgi:putative hydrolase of the HAD superfamily